ncbi:hypothetical protein [Limosilactobacillus reuteri]|uniref:hypothetical protein n=1 Tax=Limosilactobacillus reuteri TaxID=1598 RepID=UPI003F94A46E
MSDLNINFNFLGPLPTDISNELHLNKVPEYKVQNALSEQENKQIRLAQLHLQRIAEEQKQLAKKRKLQRQLEEKHQQQLEEQRKDSQTNNPRHHYKEDDGPSL